MYLYSFLHDGHIKVDSGVAKRAPELKKMGLKAMDALHIACAEKAKAKVFLTTDDNLFRKAVQNKKMLKLKIENPLRWVSEVLK